MTRRAPESRPDRPRGRRNRSLPAGEAPTCAGQVTEVRMPPPRSRWWHPPKSPTGAFHHRQIASRRGRYSADGACARDQREVEGGVTQPGGRSFTAGTALSARSPVAEAAGRGRVAAEPSVNRRRSPARCWACPRCRPRYTSLSLPVGQSGAASRPIRLTCSSWIRVSPLNLPLMVNRTAATLPGLDDSLGGLAVGSGVTHFSQRGGDLVECDAGRVRDHRNRGAPGHDRGSPAFPAAAGTRGGRPMPISYFVVAGVVRCSRAARRPAPA